MSMMTDVLPHAQLTMCIDSGWIVTAPLAEFSLIGPGPWCTEGVLVNEHSHTGTDRSQFDSRECSAKVIYHGGGGQD